jgi:hypothetical protein
LDTNLGRTYSGAHDLDPRQLAPETGCSLDQGVGRGPFSVPSQGSVVHLPDQRVPVGTAQNLLMEDLDVMLRKKLRQLSVEFLTVLSLEDRPGGKYG